MPDKPQEPVERKVTFSEDQVAPPSPQEVAQAEREMKQRVAAAQAKVGKVHNPAGVLDTSPVQEPYIVDDAKTSLGELRLVGGHIYNDPADGTRKLLDRVVMREMSGHEEDMLTDEKADLSNRLKNILASCLERIGDGKGTWITDKGKMHGIVDQLTVGDTTQMILHLRKISVYPDGEHYTFKVNCPSCKNEMRHTEDLSELKVVYMKDPMTRIYDATTPSGKVARCRVMTSEHESVVDTARQSGRNILSAIIMARVIEINGKPATMNSIKSLSAKDRNFLRQKFDEVEGGVETDVIIQCMSCGAKSEAELDIAQKDFFFPSGRS
jgi:phage FluMu protein gp41